MEGPRQILLGATRPPHCCIFFVVFVLLFVCLLSQLCFILNEKKCMNDTYIKKRKEKKTTPRYIVCPVQKYPTCAVTSRRRYMGPRLYLEKLKIRFETRNNTYIKYVGFGLVGIYGILNIGCYLMLNSLYTYILNIYAWFG